MKPCHSPKHPQSPAEPPEGSADASLSVGHIGAGWPALGLDDFGILGTHHLPLDWVGGGDVSQNSPELFPY